MTVKTLTYTSCINSCCNKILPADIIICVPSTYTLDGSHHIDGQITAVRGNYCCGKVYEQTISYDDTQLAEGKCLTASVITGIVCKDCITQYLNDIVGTDSYIKYNADGSCTFVSNQGVEYSICAPPFSDTNTISWTDCNCGDERAIWAHVKVSADTSNLLQIKSDGLYFGIPPDDGVESIGSLTNEFNSFYFKGALISGAGVANPCLRPNTVYPNNTQGVAICGGDSLSPGAGAYIQVKGNQHADKGSIELNLGNGSGSHVTVGYQSGVNTGYVRLYGGQTEYMRIQYGCLFKNMSSGNESTGAGSANLGANCPAVTAAAPEKWLKIFLSNGDTGYIPVWK